MIVDNAIYVDGRRVAEPSSLQETYEACREQRGLAWIGLHEPTEEEFSSVAEEFGLHALAVEDAVKAHQRPKIEHYDETLFVVLRPARYVDETETVEFGEVHVFVGEDFVVTVRHGAASELGKVRKRLEGEPDLLRLGPEAILYAIMDRVVDDYGPVVVGLENDIDVIQFQRATQPLPGILEDVIGGIENPELQRYLRDVQDHALRVTEQVASFRELLQNILSVNLTLVGLSQNDEVKALTQASIAQNDEVKRISAWAAILFAPTLVGTIYGMNFQHMPELHWAFGYPLALLMMLLVSLSLYAVFKHRGWL
jgi:magnesium transporter